jgi:hypothetical protein
VVGRQKIHVLRDGDWEIFADGDAFELQLRLAE